MYEPLPMKKMNQKEKFEHVLHYGTWIDSNDVIEYFTRLTNDEINNLDYIIYVFDSILKREETYYKFKNEFLRALHKRLDDLNFNNNIKNVITYDFDETFLNLKKLLISKTLHKSNKNKIITI